jgi:hypothetical protein
LRSSPPSWCRWRVAGTTPIFAPDLYFEHGHSWRVFQDRDGQNALVEFRSSSEAGPDRFPALADELVALNVDVIVRRS